MEQRQKVYQKIRRSWERKPETQILRSAKAYNRQREKQKFIREEEEYGEDTSFI